MIIDEIRRMDSKASVTAGTTAAAVVERNTDRFEAIVQNVSADTDVKVGSESALAAGGGITLGAGKVHRHCSSQKLFAKTAAGTAEIRSWDVYGPGNHQDTVREASGIAVSATRSLAVGKHPTRLQCVIQNTGETNDVFLGDATVTAANGIRLAPGESIALYGEMEVWAVCAATKTTTLATVQYVRV